MPQDTARCLLKAQAAGQTAWSLEQQYSIVDTYYLLQFIDCIRKGCQICNGGTLHPIHYMMQGHCLEFTLLCEQCRSGTEWSGSEKLQDGSYLVNRDVVRAWLVSGGHRGKYLKFTEAMRCGTYNATSFDKTTDLLIPIIREAEDKEYHDNIMAVNEMKEGSKWDLILNFQGPNEQQEQLQWQLLPLFVTTLEQIMERFYYNLQ